MAVDLHPGTNDIWGTSISVDGIHPPRHVAHHWWTIDIRVTTVPAAESPHMQVLSAARIEDLYFRSEQLREAPIYSFAPHQVPPVKTVARPKDESVPQEIRRGWVTSLCWGQPTLIGIRSHVELMQEGEATIPSGGVFGLLETASMPAIERP